MRPTVSGRCFVEFSPLSSPTRAALLLWAVVLAFIVVRVTLWPRVHTTYPIFAAAAQNWVSGVDLYYVEQLERDGLDRYRYSPMVAVGLVPLGMLPVVVGGVVWRLVNCAVLLGALAWWATSAAPRPLSGPERAWLFLLALPLSVPSLNNGQSNLLVIGLLLAGLAATAEERWNLAALALGLAGLVKIYPLAVGFLLVLLYPRQLAWRLTLVLLLGVLLPFALQRPDYVAGQYATWLHLLHVDDRRSLTLARGYQDLWMLLQIWRVPVTPRGYFAVQLGAAFLLASGCLAAQTAKVAPQWGLALVLTLGSCWMVLLGPATESSTYALLAPTLAWAILESWPRPAWRVWFAFSGLLFLIAALSGWLPWRSEIRALGVYPLAALLLLAGLVGLHVQEARRGGLGGRLPA